jgi:hypothetical protein
LYSSSTVLANSYCSILLPVELAWFNAYYSNGHITLSWKTGQPEMVDQFIIEKRTDAGDWSVIHIELASDAVFVYDYADLSAIPGNNYYRIRLIRKNSAAVYSLIRKVFIPGKNEFVAIYPNPASNKIYIRGINSPTLLTLVDQAGKIVLEQKINLPQPTVEIELPSLSRGIYIVRVGQAISKLIIN